MLLKLRQRMASEESGFTLVELLVVMLIIGLLAAIAIPAFFNQRDKAYDANAKEQARTAETAMETYATDNGGVYTGVTTAPAGHDRAVAQRHGQHDQAVPDHRGCGRPARTTRVGRSSSRRRRPATSSRSPVPRGPAS